MGLNYSYVIYVPAADVVRALGALSEMTPGDLGPVEVTLPDGEKLLLPFTSRFKSEPVDCSGDEELQLDTTILVDVEDDRAREYFQYRDEQGRGTLGYLYLGLRFVSRMHPGYASLDFMAATTGMSELMEQSASVEKAFRKLAVASGGVCSLLDRECQSLEVRWLNGEKCREAIPGTRFANGRELAKTWPDLA
jgi:hypothetical protein